MGMRFNGENFNPVGFRTECFFRNNGHNLFIDVEFTATPRIPIFVGYNYRYGTIFSYTRTQQNLSANWRMGQRTFDNLPWVYRTRLNSHTFSAGIAPELTEHITLELQYAFQRTQGSGLSYNNNLVSAALLFFF